MLALSACSREPAPTTAVAGPAEFVGSDSCASCHTTQYQDWRGSHHELAMQVADQASVLGDFSGAEFDYFGKKTLFTSRGGAYFVRTENADGEDQEFRIAYTFGVTPTSAFS